MDFLYNHWVDTIILDYHMVNMNGAETAKRVKQSFNHINIILHTSDKEMAYVSDHVDDVIIKPAKFFELAQLVKNDMLVSSR